MSPAKPLIGLTCYGRDSEGNYSLPAQYADAVRRAGGLPLALLPGDDHDELLGELGGLVLIGGGDLDPKLYDGAAHPTIYMVDPERDHSEMHLARQALKRGLPTLGICRGIQVLNVVLGGSLIAHLPDRVGQRLGHRVPPRRPVWHHIHVEPDSLLARTAGGQHLYAASWHHQAVDRPAPGLRVSARAPDGTIEALEKNDHPWLLAVQWHPELSADDDPSQQALFDGLVHAALNKETPCA